MRNTLTVYDQPLGIHEDRHNDARPQMAPVLVVARILEFRAVNMRYSTICYSRKALFETEERTKMLTPLVQAVVFWHQKLPYFRRIVSSELFGLEQFRDRLGVIRLPCHNDRMVGLSPYADSVCKLQMELGLSKEQCAAVAYHSITFESTVFFWVVVWKIIGGA